MGVLTISRQVGSLGDDIAKMVAQKQGFSLVNAREYHRLALKCDEEFQNACSAFETELPMGFFERLFFKEPANSSLFASLNYELASKGKVVLLGRGAQVVLSHEPTVLHVRILAPLDLRIDRIAKRRNISHEEAAGFVRHYDQRRRATVEAIFQKDLSDFTLYDLTFNSANLDPETISDLICIAMDKKNGSRSPQEFKDRMKGLALAKRVESAIKKKIPTTPHRNLDVQWGGSNVIILTGFVRDRRSKEKAIQIAQDQKGVDQVLDELKTTELSF